MDNTDKNKQAGLVADDSSSGAPTISNEVDPATRRASVSTKTVSLRSDGGPVAAPSLGSSSTDATAQPVILALDADEERLFHTLVSTADAYERGNLVLPVDNNDDKKNDTKQPQQQQHIEIRVAGGWVRDKLLGLHSHDVDIAVDTLSGKDFATLVQLFLKQQQHDSSQQEESSKSKSEKLCGKMGVIAANPHQSKHLETATMVVHHVEVDFTNLRAEEVYESHSRIPNTTTVGTPLEDAMRRDFTINALFFNLRTRQVEDWTGRGMTDLRSGSLVTPLDPHQTFRDDPLRVLRAIRFAVRYGFDLDNGLQQACMCQQVHRALHVKVSRERVGKELEGMLSGRGAQPAKALDTLAKLKLAGGVFCIPEQHNVVDRHHSQQHNTIYGTIVGDVYEGPNDIQRHLRELAWEEARTLMTLLPKVVEAHKEAVQKLQSDATANNKNNNNSTVPSLTTTADTRLLYLAVFLLPFRHLQYQDHKGKVQSVVLYMIRDGIKFKNKDVVGITTLMETVDQMNEFLIKAATQGGGGVVEEHNHNINTRTSNPTTTTSVCRLDAGLLLRSTKSLWVTCLLLATVAKLRETEKAVESTECEKRQTTTTTAVTTTKEQVLHLSQALYNSIIRMGLDNCWQMKPLMDGRAVIETMHLPKGPIVKTYLDEQVRWMLLNPNGSREDCETHLRQYKRVLDGQHEEQNEMTMGISDGGPSSPVHSSATGKHLSKKMHVESMDLV